MLPYQWSLIERVLWQQMGCIECVVGLQNCERQWNHHSECVSLPSPVLGEVNAVAEISFADCGVHLAASVQQHS